MADRTIRIVWGTGTGPTPMASYDAALHDAGVHDYNLVSVSSIVPADATIEEVGEAPDLGPAGNRLTVVEARGTGEGPTRASAALGWLRRPDGQGLFYEVGEATAPRSADGGEQTGALREASGSETAPAAHEDEVADRVREGLSAGRELRGWAPANATVRTSSIRVTDEHATAVVLAVYGQSESVW